MRCAAACRSSSPHPVAVVQWVVNGSWPDPGVLVDTAFAPHGTAPLI